ncbi:MAG: cytochrome c nitrite reductase small subunit [Bacteroidales bacterium]|nr:cytochrome c nitrite reductase small subunit [Bacteroidales bacterium]
MKKLIYSILPPEKWKIPVIILSGTITGIIIFLLYVSKAHSYLSDAPETCMNCHIMAPQYASWFHSSHKQITHCNDCHVPQDNVFSKYWFKAMDGLRHATIFTLRMEPQVIRIKEAGKNAVHQNCLRCHQNVFEAKMLSNYSGSKIINEQLKRNCMDCHRETPHGIVNSLSSVPNARVPLPESAVPEWLKNLLKK